MNMNRSIKPADLISQIKDKHLIDVRRKGDLDASGEALPGATWHDPEKLVEWAAHLPRDRRIVLYCARGGSVSNAVVDALHAQNLDACFVEGGIEGWKTAGGEVVKK
jgi:rhodanese-related sulfurtransferase